LDRVIEPKKKPFYEGFPVVYKTIGNIKKPFAIVDTEWKEFAGDEKDIKYI
jgi:hypothetical protein